MKKKIWIIDAIALVGFLLLFKPQITGFSLHEWLGLAIGVLLLIHFLQHWHWVKAIAKCMARVKAKQRIKFGIDGAIATGFITIIFTGLVISSLLDLDLLNYATWREVHNVASYTTLVLLLAKLALHWSLLKNTFAKAFRPAEQQPALTPMGVSRRKFIKESGFAVAGLLIGISGIAAILKSTEAAPQDAPTRSATQTPQPVLNQATTAPQSTQTMPPSPTATPQPTPTAVAQTGRVLCNKACAFPGRCRLYVDNNQNALCDRGEPIW